MKMMNYKFIYTILIVAIIFGSLGCAAPPTPTLTPTPSPTPIVTPISKLVVKVALLDNFFGVFGETEEGYYYDLSTSYIAKSDKIYLLSIKFLSNNTVKMALRIENKPVLWEENVEAKKTYTYSEDGKLIFQTHIRYINFTTKIIRINSTYLYDYVPEDKVLTFTLTEEERLQQWLRNRNTSWVSDYKVDMITVGKFQNWDKFAYAYIVTKSAPADEAGECQLFALLYLGQRFPDVDVVGVQMEAKAYPYFYYGDQHKENIALSIRNSHLQAYLDGEITYADFMKKANWYYSKLAVL